MKNSDLLEQWEDELVSYPVSIRITIIVITSLIVMWLGWEFWISSLSDSIDSALEKKIALERDISRLTPEKFEKKISLLKYKKMSSEKDIENSKYRLRNLKEESYKYSFLWFDENRFLMILKKILKYSVKLGIKIDEIKSIPIQQREIAPHIKIEKVIKIEGVGNYTDIIKMLYYIDSFKVLLEMTSIKIWLEKSELKFRIIITQYGIKL